MGKVKHADSIQTSNPRAKLTVNGKTILLAYDRQGDDRFMEIHEEASSIFEYQKITSCHIPLVVFELIILYELLQVISRMSPRA